MKVDPESKVAIGMFVVVMVMCVMWLGGGYFAAEVTQTVLRYYPERDPFATAGQIGDSFGMVNALFSGMGFGMLAIALALQYRQLKAQSRELQLSEQQHLVTSYLSAAVALRDMPPVEEIPPEQWSAAEAIRITAEKLKGLASNVIGPVEPEIDRCEYQAKSLTRLVYLIDVNTPSDVATEPCQFDSSLAMIRFVRTTVRGALQRLTPLPKGSRKNNFYKLLLAGMSVSAITGSCRMPN